MNDREKRVALVVGNGNYRHAAALDNPVNDAQAMASRLQQLGFCLIGDGAQTDLDRQQLVDAVLDFGAKIRGTGVRLFYYAGHAAQSSGENYLLPVDARPQRERDIALIAPAASELLRFMEGATDGSGSNDQLNILIFDACRVNPFVQRASRAADGGLARIDTAPRGTIIGFATRPGAIAWDEGPNGHSPYTHALLEAMSIPGLDIYQFFNRAMTLVEDLTGGEQQPWVHFTSIRGPFSLFPALPDQRPETGTLPEPVAGQSYGIAANGNVGASNFGAAVQVMPPIAVTAALESASTITLKLGDVARSRPTVPTDTAVVERRLTVILCADAVGYSRLMGADEAGTLHVLRGHREAIDPIFAAAGGRIVKTTGDGLLLEFRSAFQAVRSALSAQRIMAERNTQVAPDKRLMFRIGIHLGDVIVEEDDIFGDGVNIAARLQEIGQPGGLCLSEAVHAAVHKNIHAPFEDIGHPPLKNISTPVRVFNVVMDGAPLGPAALSRNRLLSPPAGRSRRVKAGVLAGVGAAAALGLGAYLAMQRPVNPLVPAGDAAPIAAPAPPAALLPVSPAIVPLPASPATVPPPVSAAPVVPPASSAPVPPPASSAIIASPVSLATAAPILFERGGVAFSTAALAIIDQQIVYLKANPGVSVAIDGYSLDGEGPSGTLQALAELRALKVRRRITDAGIDGSRLTIVAHGTAIDDGSQSPQQPRVVINRR